jgi:tRNA(His) 5'-end guanylyltransferase
MDKEPEIALAYNQSDEISVLIMPGSSTFNRKARKLLSLLPAAASAKFSLLLGDPVCFDCRLNIQTDVEGVLRYFAWRSIDAERNAFNACAYWLLRKQGMQPQAAAELLRSLDTPEHRKLLQDHQADSTAIPVWQTRGVIMHRVLEQRVGFNPLTQERTTCSRRVLVETDYSEELLRDIISLPTKPSLQS